MFASIVISGLFVLGSLFALALFLGSVLAAWCVMCYRVSRWVYRSMTPSARCNPRPTVNPRLAMARPAVPAPNRPRTPEHAPHHSGRQSSGVALILALIVVCLVFFGLRSRATGPMASLPPRSTSATMAPAQNAETAGDRPVSTKVDSKDAWTFVGKGATRDDAQQVALDEAYDKLRTHLRDDLHVRWMPTLHYVRAHMVKDVKYDGTRELPLLGTVHEVSLRLDVSPKDEQDFVRRDRMLLLGKLLAGLVALMVTVAIYVHLDELSKGFYSGWLRALAAGAVVAIAAAFWMLA